MKKILTIVSIFMLATTMICGFSVAGNEEVVQSSVIFHGIYASITVVICLTAFIIKDKKSIKVKE